MESLALLIVALSADVAYYQSKVNEYGPRSAVGAFYLQLLEDAALDMDDVEILLASD